MDRVSWNLGFWSSPKGAWCCSNQGETERVALCPQWGARCVTLERREKGLHNFAVAHLLAPTTLFSYGTQALVSSEAFYSHSPKTSYPTCYFYQLFLPSGPPPTSLSLLLEKNPPTYTAAAALLCPELQDTKQQEKTDSPMNASRLLPAQAPCLLRVQRQQYTQPGWQECRKGDPHVWDVIAATGHLATSWWQPSACSQTQFPLLGHHLGWLTGEWKQRKVIPPS